MNAGLFEFDLDSIQGGINNHEDAVNYLRGLEKNWTSFMDLFAEKNTAAGSISGTEAMDEFRTNLKKIVDYLDGEATDNLRTAQKFTEEANNARIC